MVTPSWAGRVPLLKPGTYADDLPFHQVEFLCCKLMLRHNHFVSRPSLFEFGEVMREPAQKHSTEWRRTTAKKPQPGRAATLDKSRG